MTKAPTEVGGWPMPGGTGGSSDFRRSPSTNAAWRPGTVGRTGSWRGVVFGVLWWGSGGDTKKKA